MVRLASLFVLLAVGAAAPVAAQDSTRAPSDTTEAWYDEAWTPIVERHGVRFSYIFYGEADNQNNGVVIRLENENERPVRYAFTIIFRGPQGEATARAEGRLAPGEMKTGEKDGLFWIPFRDGRVVGEVGLRGIRVAFVEPADAEAGLRLRGKAGGTSAAAKLSKPLSRRTLVTVATIDTFLQDPAPFP